MVAVVKGYGQGDRHEPHAPVESRVGTENGGGVGSALFKGKGGETAGSAFGYLFNGGDSGSSDGADHQEGSEQGKDGSEQRVVQGGAAGGGNIVTPSYVSKSLEQSALSWGDHGCLQAAFSIISCRLIAKLTSTEARRSRCFVVVSFSRKHAHLASDIPK